MIEFWNCLNLVSIMFSMVGSSSGFPSTSSGFPSASSLVWRGESSISDLLDAIVMRLKNKINILTRVYIDVFAGAKKHT